MTAHSDGSARSRYRCRHRLLICSAWCCVVCGVWCAVHCSAHQPSDGGDRLHRGLRAVCKECGEGRLQVLRCDRQTDRIGRTWGRLLSWMCFRFHTSTYYAVRTLSVLVKNTGGHADYAGRQQQQLAETAPMATAAGYEILQGSRCIPAQQLSSSKSTGCRRKGVYASMACQRS